MQPTAHPQLNRDHLRSNLDVVARAAAIKLKRQALALLPHGSSERRPQDPFKLAAILGLEIIPVSKLYGDARLFKVGAKWLVEIAKHTSKVRQRFSCAHELGHYLLQVHAQDVLASIHDVAPNDGGDNFEERVCNLFAAEFLFPTSAIMSMVNRRGGLRMCDFIDRAERCEVSLRTAAIQVVSAKPAYVFCLIKHFAVGSHAADLRVAWSAAPSHTFVPKYSSVGSDVAAALASGGPSVGTGKVSLGSVRGTYRFAAQPNDSSNPRSGGWLLIYLDPQRPLPMSHTSLVREQVPT